MFEYKVMYFEFLDQKLLDAEGRHRWELCGFAPYRSPLKNDLSQWVTVWKREIDPVVGL